MTSLSDLDTTAVPTPKALKLGCSSARPPRNSLPRSRTEYGLACEPASVGSGTHRNCNLNGTCLLSAIFVLSTSESAQIHFPARVPCTWQRSTAMGGTRCRARCSCLHLCPWGLGREASAPSSCEDHVLMGLYVGEGPGRATCLVLQEGNPSSRRSQSHTVPE